MSIASLLQTKLHVFEITHLGVKQTPTRPITNKRLKLLNFAKWEESKISQQLRI